MMGKICQSSRFNDKKCFQKTKICIFQISAVGTGVCHKASSKSRVCALKNTTILLNRPPLLRARAIHVTTFNKRTFVMLDSSSQRLTPSSTIMVGNSVVPWISCRYLVGKRTWYMVKNASN